MSSSEDIDKGARWSTDIANELSDSTFGILCVTRENINEPWLIFEAGALSKSMENAYVSPFLFDIKQSEIDGPILQFQSTTFEKDDLKKLVTTLNKACDQDSLTEERLNKTFEVWYPTLEEDLDKLKHVEPAEQDSDETTELQTPKSPEILEKILELSRINQKLIRNSDRTLGTSLEEMSSLLRTLIERTERLDSSKKMLRMSRLHPRVLEELMQISLSKGGSGYVGIQLVLGLLKNQYPWIYDIGIETINILRSRRGMEEKHRALDQFRNFMSYSFDHPMMREFSGDSEDMRYIQHRLQQMLMETFERNL